MQNSFAELRTFVTVVDAGTITAAADRLGVAKSAVSRRLGELESRLGVQLLKRTTRSLRLTESGRSLYQRGVQLLEDLDEVERAVSQEHCELAGRIRVAAPQSFGLRHLASAVSDFVELHPEVVFDLDLNDRQVSLLDEGFDLALRIAKLSDSSFIAKRLATSKSVVCASPEYLSVAGRPKTPCDLRDHRCLVYSNLASPGTWRYSNAKGEQKSVTVPVHLSASSGDFLAELAIAGRGIVLEPDFIAYEAIEAGTLEPVLTDYDWNQLDLHALYPSTRYLSRRVRAFIDFLSDRFAGVPYWQRCLNGE